MVGNENLLLVILYGAIIKALALQSERRRFNPRPFIYIFGFSINVAFENIISFDRKIHF